MKGWIVVGAIAIMFGAAIFVGLDNGMQKKTSIITGKTEEVYWNKHLYLFAMENGDAVKVSYGVYANHQIGDNFTYRQIDAT